MMLIFGIILLSVSQIFAFNTYDCGATKNCFYVHNATETNCDPLETNKDSKNYCHFAMSYLHLEDDPDYVMIELRRPRYNDNLVHQMVYVAMGLSTDDIMGNDSVVQCYFNESASFNDRRPFEIFLSWNENHDNGTDKHRSNVLLPNEYVHNRTESSYNAIPVSGLITESMYSCTFKRRIRPVISHISPEWHDVWDLNNTYNIFMAYGNVNHENGYLLYHGNNKVIIAEKKNLVAPPPLKKSPPGECGTTKRCFGLPADCDMKATNPNDKNFCKSRLYVTPKNSDGTVTMELFASRLNRSEYGGGQSYVAAGFSKSGGMVNASVVHCVFRDDGDYVAAYQSYNFLNSTSDHYDNRVLPEELGNSSSAQNVKLMSRQSDDNYFSCTVTRKVSPLAEANQSVEVFPLDQEYTLIMAWGRAKDVVGGQLQYHYGNKGVVSKKPVDVTQPIPKTGSASTVTLSYFTSLFAIGIYMLLKN